MDSNPISLLDKANAFPTMLNLKKLSLNNMPDLKKIEAGSLSNLPALQHLYVANCPKLFYMSGDALVNHVSWRQVFCSDYCFTLNGRRDFFTELFLFKKVFKLNILKCWKTFKLKIKKKSVKIFQWKLISLSCETTNITIEKNNYFYVIFYSNSVSICKRTYLIFFVQLQNNTRAYVPLLKTLELSNNSLEHLSLEMAQWDKLEELHLMNNQWSCDCGNDDLVCNYSKTRFPVFQKCHNH